MQPALPLVLVSGYLLLGIAAGIVLQRSHFCTMGCVSDAVLFGSLRRLRVWALALAVALLGSQALDAAGLVDLGAQRLPAAKAGCGPAPCRAGCCSASAWCRPAVASAAISPASAPAASRRAPHCWRSPPRPLATALIAAADWPPRRPRRPPIWAMPLALVIAAASAGVLPAPCGLSPLARGSRHRAGPGRPDPAGLAGHGRRRQAGPIRSTTWPSTGRGSCCRWPPARCSVRWPRHWPGASSGSSGSPPRATCGAISSAALLMGVGGTLALGLHHRPGADRCRDLEPRLLSGPGRHARRGLVGREASGDRSVAALAAQP